MTAASAAAAPASHVWLRSLYIVSLLAAVLTPTTADDSVWLASQVADAVVAAQLSSPVSISGVSPAPLREAVRAALWRRAVPVLDAPPPLPPTAPVTVLLAGPLPHVAAEYQRLSRRPAAGSRHLRWLLAAPADAQQARSTLQPLLHESRRVLVLACSGNSSCARLAATSPGRAGVRLVDWPADQPLPDWRLRQLGGRTLRVLAPMRRKLPSECSSPTIAAYITPEGEKRLCGYLGEIINIISEKFNFQMELIRKGGCGIRQSDGSMNGRPSWLVAGRGDLAAGTCTVDVQRSAAVYMGEWFWSDTTSIATGWPDHQHSDFLVFGVLTDPVWALTVGYILLFAVLLRQAEKIGRAIRGWVHDAPRGEARCRDGDGADERRRPVGKGVEVSRRGRVASLVDYTQQSVRMFLGQGDDVTSSLPSTRLLMIFVYMTTVTLMSVYSGNLTAFFSIRRDSRAIDSLEDLAASPLEPHVTFGQSHYYVFENATSGAHGQIWRKMQACSGCVHKSYTSTETIQFIEGIIHGRRALFQSQRSLLKRADQYLRHTGQPAFALCPLRLARQALRRDFYSLMFPHYSPYSDLFDEAIRRLRYQGVIESIFAREAANKCTRNAAPHHEVASLDWHRMAGAFYVWAAGLAAALIVWVLECCMGCGCSRRRYVRKVKRKTKVEREPTPDDAMSQKPVPETGEV